MIVGGGGGGGVRAVEKGSSQAGVGGWSRYTDISFHMVLIF